MIKTVPRTAARITPVTIFATAMLIAIGLYTIRSNTAIETETAILPAIENLQIIPII